MQKNALMEHSMTWKMANGVFRHVDVELLILMTKVLDIQLLNGIQVSN